MKVGSHFQRDIAVFVYLLRASFLKAMSDESKWVHVYVFTPETEFQVFDPKERPPRPAKPGGHWVQGSIYTIALRILLILSRLL